MLRADWEANINAILTRSAEQADLYADAADHVVGKAAALCRKMAERRRALADALETALRNKGRLPKEMDPDRETADKWMTAVRSALSGHEAESLLHSRLAADENLDHAIAEAMADSELPADLRAVLDRFWTDLDSDRHELAAFLGSGNAPQ